jgi:competence/damage-inducible protein CinA-like protein
VRPRAAVVVTGSELVRGERTDLNGPFLAREVLRLGFEPARVTIVGDAVAELEGALREALADAALVAVSGGLGPTHDDRTIEAVARVTGRPLVVDAALHAEIESIARGYAERMRRPYDDFVPGVRKQATVPEGAVAVGIAGTAPAVVVEHGAGVVVVLPGPPGELQRLWPRALETQPVRAVLAQAVPPTRRALRFFGINESAVAQALEAAGGEREGVEVTICARDFEIHVDVVVGEGADKRAEELLARLREPLERYLFADDHRSAEAIVLDLLRQRSWTLATAESCTGGMVAERLTGVPGASDVFLGAVVAYADAIKEAELGVPASVLRQHGAVSAETAAAMARGARERLGADVAVAVTGIAGPGGGTVDKPVGLVYVHAESPEGDERLTFDYPGDREAIRRRATASALHAVRRLLTRIRHEVA